MTLDKAGILTVGSRIDTEKHIQNQFGHALKNASRDVIFKERIRQEAIINRRFAAFYASLSPAA